ncbi:MAG: asparagine synthase (glutamine-hydrolyzing) [Gemmatimonadaceae bacterium]|nr:asparagine synthase (glutamine-hydrolyzing) [Gemmatimonadaceae bacterium]
MCGILGFASAGGVADDLAIARQRDTLRHRGPDDEGLWRSSDNRISFSHRRLSIVDLSCGGHQPMASPDGAVHVVFNGELYNYLDLRDELRGLGATFSTASDTEVLLAAYAAWGERCVEHFNGMYAFVLHDAKRGILFGARDRAGEKPFFYRHQGGRFAFASELKALLADSAAGRHLDLEAFNSYLAYGYAGFDQCMLKGFRKLPAAHSFTYRVQEDEFRIRRYWELPEPPDQRHAPDTESLLEELEGLLQDSVRRQLIADVPVGILLSGGIDSSLITAMAARVGGSSVHTFTISFPGHGSYDEGPIAKLVAAHFGTTHTELVADAASVDLLPILARQFDEPMADSSMIPTYLVSKLVRRHATVALGGDGGDELFAGYHHYSWIKQQERTRSVVPRPVRRAIGAVTEKALPVGFKGRNRILGYTADLDESLARWGIFFDREARARLAPSLAFATSDAPERWKRTAFRERATTLQRATAEDFASYMTDDILVKVDRASMLNSLEVRAPWLDYRLIEFAFGRVPDRLRASSSARKILPRRLAARLLPKSVDLRRKQGFSIPLDAWFSGPWGELMEDTLRGADPAIFDQREIDGLLRAQRSGRAHSNRLFALTIFELWRREYGVTLE